MTALNCNKEITENMGGVHQDFFQLSCNLTLYKSDADKP